MSIDPCDIRSHVCCGSSEEAPAHAVGTGARAENASIGGAVVAAILSSACCWLPLLLLAFGASAAGIGAFFERWRPWLAGGALALLGVAFWLVYFRRASCAEGPATPVRARRGVFTQAVLWMATILVVAFVLFPRYAGAVARSLYGEGTPVGATSTDASRTVLQFGVEGMTCEACAITLEADLVKIDGVISAEVDYDTKSARVEAADAGIVREVEAATKRHGYTATLAPGGR